MRDSYCIPVLPFLNHRFAYAPYGVLRKMGVNGPTPRPFWGNAREFAKVSSVWQMSCGRAVPACMCVCQGRRERHGPCGTCNSGSLVFV